MATNPIYENLGTTPRVWNTTETGIATKESYVYKHSPRVDIIKTIAQHPFSTKDEILGRIEITEGQFNYNINVLLDTQFIVDSVDDYGNVVYSLNPNLQRPVISNLATSIWKKAHN